MNSKILAPEIDRVLRPLGFTKRKMVWNRKVSSAVDVIDIQDSKDRNSFTLNVGVFRPEFFKFCWDTKIPDLITEPMCTIRSRIGRLFERKDVWWSRDDPDLISDIIDKLSIYVLPFLDQMHNSKAMEEFLEKTNVVKQKYPPPIIYLALLKNENGDKKGALKCLLQLSQKTNSTWQPTVEKVIESIGANMKH